MSEPQYLTKRHGVWHFLRRVPTEYAHLDTRGNVKLSTKIKIAADPKGIKASQIAALMNDTVEAYWHDLANQNPLEWTMARAQTLRARGAITQKSGCQLYRHFNKNGVLLYVGISLSAVNRLGRHKTTAGWFSRITKVTVEKFDSREAALVAERIAIRDEKPRHNIASVPLADHKPEIRETRA